MGFTISIQEKKLVSSLDVLEEIHLKQSRGYRLIGFIRESTLTVSPSYKCGDGSVKKLAENFSSPYMNHFEIVGMEYDSLGWVFVLLDNLPDADKQAFVEWETLRVWLGGDYNFSPYGVRTLSRRDIEEIEAGGEGNTNYPKYDKTLIDEYYKTHFDVMQATAVELSVSEIKEGEKVRYHLAGVMQLNECVTEETRYYAEQLARLLAHQWENSKVVLIVRDDPLGTEHYSLEEKIRVGYIAVYVKDICSIEQGKMVEVFNKQIHQMKESLGINFILYNRNVRLCLAGDHTLRQIIKTNLINTFPNCFSDPSDEAVKTNLALLNLIIKGIMNWATDKENYFSDTKNKDNATSKLNVIA